MKLLNHRLTLRILLGFLLVFIPVFTVACTSSTTGGNGEQDTDGEMDHEEMEEEGMDHDEEMEHEDDHDHDDHAEVPRVPNNGAEIRLIAPADNATFKSGDEVVVEVEVENIIVGEDGNHWHIYIDGSSWGMVMGHNMDEVLRGLEPGEHEISVYLSIETHEELEDGDNVMIMVEE